MNNGRRSLQKVPVTRASAFKAAKLKTPSITLIFKKLNPSCCQKANVKDFIGGEILD